MPSQGENMNPYNAVELADMELFVAHDDHRSWGVLRTAGANQTGAAGFKKALAAAGDDPQTLAHLAMLFLDKNVAGRAPWSSAETGSIPPEELALAREPALADGVLEYWRRHEQMAGLVRCRVTLAEPSISCELASALVRGAQMSDDPMATIEKDLGAWDIPTVERGIKELGKLKTPAAVERLTDLALNHKDFRARTSATKALTGVKGSEVGATLSRILLFDGHEETRRAAAMALGERGEPSAREALEKAEKGDASGRVRGAATHALSQLPK